MKTISWSHWLYSIAQINISKKIKYDAVKKYQPKNLLRISFLRHKTLMIKIWYNHFMFDKWPCCNCQYTSRKSVFMFLKILQETLWLFCLEPQEKIHILILPPLPCCKECTINFIYTFAIYMILLYMYLWYVLIILYLYLNTYCLTISV